MIKSMTGYGGAKDVCEGLGITVELKSVNNRYLDCSVRLPRNFIFCEEAVKSLVSGNISRGKVDVFVTVDSLGADDVEVRVNEALAAGYLRALREISEKLGVPDDATSVTIGKMPDVLTTEKREADRGALTAGITRIAAVAIAEFNRMREREGEKLREDIASRLGAIEALVAAVEERSPETVREYRERLYRKMTEALSSASVDEQRILLEAAVFADKVAVDEETVRLRSHISQMREMLQAGSPIGRKMDFLIQEFNREANTIGSKCTNSDISKTVIELKSEIEKIREQIQNIE